MKKYVIGIGWKFKVKQSIRDLEYIHKRMVYRSKFLLKKGFLNYSRSAGAFSEEALKKKEEMEKLLEKFEENNYEFPWLQRMKIGNEIAETENFVRSMKEFKK